MKNKILSISGLISLLIFLINILLTMKTHASYTLGIGVNMGTMGKDLIRRNGT